jgi:DNA-directed RNA polymerase specialized sigma24 family protein
MLGYVRDLLRHWGGRASDHTDAEDIVGSYLARCMEKGWLSRTDEEIRNFRAYVQVQLSRFTCSWFREKAAQRRGGGLVRKDLDDRVPPSSEGDPAAQALEADWMEIAIGRALVALRRRGKRDAEVILDMVKNKDGGRCSRGLGARLGLDASQLAVVKSRARRRLATLLADELRRGVSDDEAFEAEWALLARYAPWLEPPEAGQGKE